MQICIIAILLIAVEGSILDEISLPISASQRSRLSARQYGSPGSSSSNSDISDNSQGSAQLGDSCSADSDCSSIKRSICDGSVCSCAEGSVEVAGLYCFPEAQNFGDECAVSEQCQNLDPMATCYKDKCICEPIFHVAGLSSATPSGTAYNVHVSAGTGASAGGGATASCLQKRKLHQSCQTDKQCRYGVWDSECDASTGTCKCSAGYVALGDQNCVPQAQNLHDKCSVDQQCSSSISGALCRNNLCTCDPKKFIKVTSTGRKKRDDATGNSCQPIRHLFESCVVNEQCSRKTKNSVCQSGTCQCDAGYVNRGPSLSECLPKIMVAGEQSPTCILTSQCMVSGTVCRSDTNRCECPTNQCFVNGNCVNTVGFNQACTTNCECGVTNSFCEAGWCVCKRGTQFNFQTNMCQAQQLSFAQSCFNCMLSPSCPLVGNVAVARNVCTVSLASTSTVPTFTFSTDSTIATINSTTGLVTINSGVTVSTTQTVSVTARSSSNSSLSATSKVLVAPDQCCTLSLCGAIQPTTVFLLDGDGAMADVGCAGVDGTAAVIAANANGLINLSTLPVINPCNGKPVAATSTGITVTGMVGGLMCGVDASNNLIVSGGADLSAAPNDAGAATAGTVLNTCTVTRTVAFGGVTTTLVENVIVDISDCFGDN